MMPLLGFLVALLGCVTLFGGVAGVIAHLRGRDAQKATQGLSATITFPPMTRELRIETLGAGGSGGSALSLGAFDAVLRQEYGAIAQEVIQSNARRFFTGDYEHPKHGPHRWNLIPVREFVDTEAFPAWYSGYTHWGATDGSCLVDPHEDCCCDC